MKIRCRHIVMLLLAFPISGYAQRSCVFLPEAQPENTFDRPKPKLRPHNLLSLPSDQNFPNAVSDFPNIDISLFYGADQNEPSVAINPVNPNNIIVGANDYRNDTSLTHFETFDGGLTWKNSFLVTNWVFSASPSDPGVAFNSSGVAFYSFGRLAAGNISKTSMPINDVVCYNSTNGGSKWSLPVRVILDSTGNDVAKTLADKYYLAADRNPASQYRDRIYISWSEFDLNGNSRIRLSYSSDGGVHWSIPANISQYGHYHGSIPTVGANGEVYVVYENMDPANKQILLAFSGDGGNSFFGGQKIASYIELGPDYPAGSEHPSIKNYLRANSFPSIAVDYSNLHKGRVYITWTAKGADGADHIFLTASDDLGNHWTAPKPIENDPSPIHTDKFFPWIAIDDSTGDVGIAAYDSRTDPSNVLTDLFMFLSRDGGATFTAQRISGVSSDVRSNSSLDTLQSYGPAYFFGDYNGLAGRNKTWYPSWTDSRIGYDQEIYIGIVRPYAPSAPRNFIAIEDSISHLPDLSWQHSGLTTFGEPVGGFHFHLKRSDGMQTDLPNSLRSYRDTQAILNTNYSYSLQAINASGDTSTTALTNFSTRASREPMPPIVTSGKAMAGSVQFHFRIPDKNVAGSALTNLNKIYYLANGIVRDSFVTTDASRGQVLIGNLQLPTDGYYNIQLAASTKQSDVDTTLSALSAPIWMYSGSPLASYEEDFADTKNIFSPFAWDTTRAHGELPENFINDSLPDVAYKANINTWFLLPPLTINSDAHTLEFTHEALVAPGDSAIVEFSLDDGVNFSPLKEYDIRSHPSDWGASLSLSRPVHEAIALKHNMGSDAIIRFQLATHSSGGDGWFLDSIRFTALLSVLQENTSSLRAGMESNPVQIGKDAKLLLSLDKASSISVNIFTLLGTKEESLLESKMIPAGNFELSFSPKKEGCYFYEITSRSGNSEQRQYGKFVVVP